MRLTAPGAVRRGPHPTRRTPPGSAGWPGRSRSRGGRPVTVRAGGRL